MKRPASYLQSAADRLYSKLSALSLDELDISEYNRSYLKRYVQHYRFYMSQYLQLMQKSIKHLYKPITESVFVDYGGGSGMLSYLAKEAGFKSVIYSDIYDVSTHDAKIIATALGYQLDNFICGDIDEFTDTIIRNNIKPDVICSFDVIEHIYDLKKWFNSISQIQHPFSIVFMTSANSANPYVRRKLKHVHNISEYQGKEKTEGWKDRDSNIPYVIARENIIRENFPELDTVKVQTLAKKTRDLRKDDILVAIKEFLEKGHMSYKPSHSTNTCDPYTGNRDENLIDVNWLKQVITKTGYTVRITNSLYGFSKNAIFNVPKRILNILINLLGEQVLMISPTYTVEARKRSG